ncbi:MAG: type II toxin-antitoxin system death-on-curing family toxin [Acidobacteriota bacterium]
MPDFLGLDEVLALHEDQIQRYGGSPGLRDLGLLSSAVALPKATFDGEFLHEDVFAMSAAYLYHLAKNHPFVDGNKRIALATCLAFLWINGYRLEAEEDALVDLVLAVASGSASKAEVTVFLSRHAILLGS